MINSQSKTKEMNQFKKKREKEERIVALCLFSFFLPQLVS
jgi:hypothetical protein